MAGKALWLEPGVGRQIAMTAGDGTVRVRMIARSSDDRAGMPFEDRCRRATA